MCGQSCKAAGKGQYGAWVLLYGWCWEALQRLEGLKELPATQNLKARVIVAAQQTKDCRRVADGVAGRERALGMVWGVGEAGSWDLTLAPGREPRGSHRAPYPLHSMQHKGSREQPAAPGNIPMVAGCPEPRDPCLGQCSL